MEVVLSRQNAHEATAFIELGEAIGASEVNFSTMAPQGRAQQRRQDLLDYDLWRDLTQTLRAASHQAAIPVTPNCALLGPCFANIEPHITCDGWMTPCYLSSTKLFNLLEVAPELVREYLTRDRLLYQDVCGRRSWLQPGSGQAIHSDSITLAV